MARREMSIACRHRDGLVAEKHLNRLQVYTIHGQSAGEGVAKGVPRHTLDSGPCYRRIEPIRWVLDREDRTLRGATQSFEPLPQFGESGQCDGVQTNVPGTAILGLV